MVSAQIVQAVVQGTADGTASYQLPAAAAGKLGGVALANAVSDSSASDVSGINKTLNALLASLRDAGVIAKS